ncbi:MAG TPA: anti-sigma factor [Hyphomicrobiaceae bacterium]|nr:anti-sigma factor [Hyphomicrobiaceae bacterium]
MSGRRVGEAELHAYVDGELTASDRAELEAAIATRPEDLHLAREISDLNQRLVDHYAHLLVEPLPPRLGLLAQRLIRRSRRRWRWQPGAVAAAVLLALVAAAAGYMARGLQAPPEPAFLASALSAHRVFVPEVRHPVEVGAAEETHLVQWLTRRVGAEVRAPDLADQGWKLIGGRLLADRGQAAAQFMYQDGGGRRLTLYLSKEPGLGDAAFRFAERGDFGAFYWVDRSLAYALAGRLDRNELMQLATSVYAQLGAPVSGRG